MLECGEKTNFKTSWSLGLNKKKHMVVEGVQIGLETFLDVFVPIRIILATFFSNTSMPYHHMKKMMAGSEQFFAKNCSGRFAALQA